MSEPDGKVVIFDEQRRMCIIEGIARWEEAQSKAVVIAEYNIKRKMPPSYYLLNPSSSNWIEGEDFVNIDPNEDGYEQNLMILKDKILHRNNIRGATPLDAITRHIKNSLDEKDIKVPVCYNIITDGEPNKKRLFENELRYLANHFTIFLTINLCTDNDDIIEYYNDLDVKIGSELGGLDVIDDYKGEQLEVIKAGNTFITYSHDIHICRMAGCNSVVADLLDETALSVFHANKLVKELLNNPSDLPHWTNRQAYIEKVQQLNTRVYNLHKKGMDDLINTEKLNQMIWLYEKKKEWQDLLADNPYLQYCLYAIPMAIFAFYCFG